MRGDHQPKTWGFLTSKTGVVLFAFLAIAGFYLVTEHTAHFFGALPYLLFLACPLMMLFHGGHGSQKDGVHDAHEHHRMNGAGRSER